MEWQDIRTAPLNGDTVLIYDKPFVLAAEYDGKWRALGWEDTDYDVMPTHWMPFPGAPDETAE